MICTETVCLTDGAIRTVFDNGAARIIVGYIDKRPFSVLLVDTRNGAHLHLPVSDLEPALALKVLVKI